jgi:hypothetical protein
LLETLILVNKLSGITRGIIVADFEGLMFILAAENAMRANHFEKRF